MEVEESWHHQGDRDGGGGGGGSSDNSSSGGSDGVHANKETGFQAALVATDARPRSTGEEESHCQGGEAHAAATSPTAEEDGSNLIEAGNFAAASTTASAVAAGKKSPPPAPPPSSSSRLLMRRRLLPTTTLTTKQNILSRGDLPHANTHCIGNMTINQLHQAVQPEKSSDNSEAVEAMAIDGRRESDDDVPMNLVSGQREEAVNLTKCSHLVTGLSAKMRLKKQRLEAMARTSSSELNSSSQRSLTNFSDHSALHRLAEAAERKQEEEMLEMGEGSISLPPNYNLKFMSSSRGDQDMMSMSSVGSGSNGVSITPVPPNNQTYNHHTPSPDSAIHSASGCSYSPSQSPIQSRQLSGVSSPFSLASLSRNNSDASQHGSPNTTLHLSSPHDSPVQVRHSVGQARPLGGCSTPRPVQASFHAHQMGQQAEMVSLPAFSDGPMGSGGPGNEGGPDVYGAVSTQPGISRQQLINSPCPVCGDKISGFHYGIFSCESCKGFFKRTVQNKKNYQCLRGASCPISIATRKKCPACRFNKCLTTGMKLEAIREDRTRGGRSTYQCSYTLPAGLTTNASQNGMPPNISLPTLPLPLKVEADEMEDAEQRLPTSQSNGQTMQSLSASGVPVGEENSRRPDLTNTTLIANARSNVPLLIQEIMDVEHLWFSSSTRPQEKDMELTMEETISPEENMVQTLTNMADKRLFKLVKWCKSLPLFKNILIDDQISLLINAWCELLVFSCCYRSIDTPGVIRVSNQKKFTLEAARELGIEKWIEKMLHFSDQLRRLKIDCFEYVSMKVIVLLTSDASPLKEPNNVRDSQEKVVQALQHYTATQYPDMPAKFAELLLRMPELHRVCQGCKEMLCPRQPTEGEMPGFNLLMELLRGDH